MILFIAIAYSTCFLSVRTQYLIIVQFEASLWIILIVRILIEMYEHPAKNG